MKTRLVLFTLLAAMVAVPMSAEPAAKRTQPSVTAALVPTAFPVPMPLYVAEAIREAAATYDVDPNLVASMAYRESRFDPNAVSRAGAVGVMQLKPRTARYLGVKDIYDARDNIFGGTKYLRELLDRFNGDVDLSLAAYNAGPEAVAKKGVTATREAIDYVAAVKSFYRGALATL